MPRKPKPPAPGATPDIEAMIRVDHAGEYGAVRIYQGQLAVLKRRKGAAASVDTIRHMAEQEQRHLKAFDRLVNERRVRPTALEPIWRVAGFALGAATAAMARRPPSPAPRRLKKRLTNIMPARSRRWRTWTPRSNPR